MDSCLRGHRPGRCSIHRATDILSPEGRCTGPFLGQQRRSPKLLGTERTGQGGTMYNRRGSHIPRKQDFPLLHTLPCLNIIPGARKTGKKAWVEQ